MPSWIIKIEPDCPIALDVLLGFPKVILPLNVTVWCIPEAKSTVIVEPYDNEDTAAAALALLPKSIPPVTLSIPLAVSAASDLKKEPESMLSNVVAFTFVILDPLIAEAVPVKFAAGMPVILAPLPANVVAVKVPFEELNDKLLPVLGAKLPDAPVVNTGKQVVSDDSSPTDIVVAIAAVPEVSWFPDVLTPVRFIFADPSKLTPPIFLAVVNVAADPVVF